MLSVKYKAYADMLFMAGEYYGHNLQTIPSLLCALFAFLGFEKLDIKTSKVINTISSATFGVYVIHQVPSFYPYLWKWLKVYDIGQKNWGVLYIIICIITVYLVCTIIDLIRQKFIEKHIFKNSKICSFCARMNRWFEV